MAGHTIVCGETVCDVVAFCRGRIQKGSSIRWRHRQRRAGRYRWEKSGAYTAPNEAPEGQANAKQGNHL